MFKKMKRKEKYFFHAQFLFHIFTHISLRKYVLHGLWMIKPQGLKRQCGFKLNSKFFGIIIPVFLCVTR